MSVRPISQVARFSRLGRMSEEPLQFHPIATSPGWSLEAGHFSAICDVPWAVLLDNRPELVVHASILPPRVDPQSRDATLAAFG